MNILDLRHKIGSDCDRSSDSKEFTIVCQNKDRVEILLLDGEIKEHTVIGFRNLLQLLPNLQYIDLYCTRSDIFGSAIIMAEAIKDAVRRGIIIDARYVGDNIMNKLKDCEHTNLYKKCVYFDPECVDCRNLNSPTEYYKLCDFCKSVKNVGSSVWSVIYKNWREYMNEPKITQDDINNVTLELNNMIDNIPDYVVDELYMYLLNNNIYHDLHPNYPIDKITKSNVKLSLIKYLKEFKIILTDDKELYNKFEGDIFGIFELGEPLFDEDDMYGWKALFEHTGLGYMECDQLYSYINECNR